MQFHIPFTHEAGAARVIFGAGSLALLGQELARLGARRPMVLTTEGQKAQGLQVLALEGARGGRLFAGAVMHTPVTVTEQAMAELGDCDCLVAIGGGSTIGLAKAMALRSKLAQIALPTTFAGSEATPVLGQTAAGEKITLSDPALRPGTIIYDAELVCSLPTPMLATSALNAIAHAVEGLYAKDRTPFASLMAMEGIRAFVTALPRIATSREDLEAWSMAQYASWLCGSVLGQVGMALHHKLCHVLGGSFGLPHAETHAVVLAHAVAYNEAAVPQLLAPVAALFGSETAAQGIATFARDLGAPVSLGALGFALEDIDRAVEIALAKPYWNPRPLDAAGLRGLLQRATLGHAPAA